MKISTRLLEALQSIAKTAAVFVLMCSPVFAASLAPEQLDALTNAQNTAGIPHKYVPGSLAVYSKAQIDYILSTYEQGAKSYAMFIIPLNSCKMDPSQPTNTVFTSFELKASTNNFTAAEDLDKIVFWSMSSFTDIVLDPANVEHRVPLSPTWNPQLDSMRLYVENTPAMYNETQVLGATSIDTRRYQRVASSIAVPWPYYASSYVAIVEVGMCFTHLPAEEWLKSTNDELVWTYIRATADGAKETDKDNRPLWHPIAPVKWFKQLPKWADQQPVSEEDMPSSGEEQPQEDQL